MDEIVYLIAHPENVARDTRQHPDVRRAARKSATGYRQAFEKEARHG